MKKKIKNFEQVIKKYVTKLILKDRKTYPLINIRPAFYFDKQPKILLLRHDRIGDLLISTSFIKILRNHEPSASIEILLSEKNYPAKSSIEKNIDRIWILKKNIFQYITLLYNLRKRKFDLIIDLFDTSSSTSAIIIKYANPLYALGIEKANSNIYDYTVPMLDRFKSNIVERVCNLLIAFGINPQENDLSLEYPILKYEKENTTNFRFGINLAGSSKQRFWGIENNEKLIEILLTKYINFEIKLFYTADYSGIADILSTKYPSLKYGLIKEFDDFVAEVSQCNLIITPDTSIVHLASTFKIPAIIMYIVSEKAQHSPWHPYNSVYRAIYTNEDSIQNIPPSVVINTIDNLINEMFPHIY